MEQGTTTILEGYSDLEKGAYLGAIASIATADRSASEEELDYIEALCEGAELSEAQTDLIRRAAMEPMADDDLKRCLDVLKTSDLRFSLISDLIAFAESDQNYTPEEKQSVEKVASYLGIDQQQLSLLDQFTKKAVQEAPAQAQALQDGTTQPGNFLGGLGFGDKMKGAGINTNALMKGALAVMGPILLAQMFRGGRRRRSRMGGGMIGGGFGGMLGGGLLGGLLAGGMSRGMGGGLFDIIGGGRGFRNSGGMLGRILGGRRF